ncbi:MAG: hypothetical protein KKA54_12190 [Proteobacteria bacterium]|nr:hypothetical protein [Pseudomonadota bacterium]MBU0967125.1 hypothetical protein [Pseudomonadota bacterium]
MPFFFRISALLLFLFLYPSLALADVVVLKNGDTLSGKIVAVTEDAITLEHEILGILTLPKSKLKSDEDTIGVLQPEKKATPGVFGTNFLAGWNRRVALGVKGEEGNDVSLNLNGALDASYEDKDNRLALSGAYFYESTGP